MAMLANHYERWNFSIAQDGGTRRPVPRKIKNFERDEFTIFFTIRENRPVT